jgi:hypothetical protein
MLNYLRIRNLIISVIQFVTHFICRPHIDSTVLFQMQKANLKIKLLESKFNPTVTFQVMSPDAYDFSIQTQPSIQ